MKSLATLCSKAFLLPFSYAPRTVLTSKKMLKKTGPNMLKDPEKGSTDRMLSHRTVFLKAHGRDNYFYKYQMDLKKLKKIKLTLHIQLFL